MEVLRNLIALALVTGVPALVVLGGFGACHWARWMIGAGTVGIAGLVLTVMAAVNLTVPRACDGARNRPVLAAIVEEGDCRRTSLGQVELAVLVGLVPSLVLTARRRQWAPSLRR